MQFEEVDDERRERAIEKYDEEEGFRVLQLNEDDEGMEAAITWRRERGVVQFEAIRCGGR